MILLFLIIHLNYGFYYKVGILGCFKKEKPNFQICYIEEIDAKKRQICLRYFTSEKVFESIQLDGVDIIPDFIKTVQQILSIEFLYMNN